MQNIHQYFFWWKIWAYTIFWGVKLMFFRQTAWCVEVGWKKNHHAFSCLKSRLLVYVQLCFYLQSSTRGGKTKVSLMERLTFLSFQDKLRTLFLTSYTHIHFFVGIASQPAVLLLYYSPQTQTHTLREKKHENKISKLTGDVPFGSSQNDLCSPKAIATHCLTEWSLWSAWSQRY